MMAAITVNTTPQQVPGGWAELQNLGSVDVWYGPDNTVSASNGIKLAAGSSSYRLDPSTAWKLWVVTASGTADLRVFVNPSFG